MTHSPTPVVNTLLWPKNDTEVVRPGFITPLDPFPSSSRPPSRNGREEQSLGDQQLTRGLLSIVEKSFPVGMEEDESAPSDRGDRDARDDPTEVSSNIMNERMTRIHHPLLFLAEQARMQWADPKESDQSSSSRTIARHEPDRQVRRCDAPPK